MTKKRVTLLTALAVVVFASGVYLHSVDARMQEAKNARFFDILGVSAQDTTATPEVTEVVSPTETPVSEETFKPLKIKKGTIDYFLKVDGITGDSTNKKHPNEIELDSYSWGAENAASIGSGSGSGAGKVKFNEFTFSSTISKASPALFQAVASGKHLKEVVLTLNNKKTGQDFYIIKLSDVLISSYHEATNGELLPAILIGMNFGKIEISYFPQKNDGSLAPAVKAGWDAVQNKAL